ncbi:methyl-accepting chemotaxis protein [Brevibacillus sp. TJ4]|uniref:methyl-accepting chemotaxis protein n=1 Tax=Brevibacillus sp. TJ4 TaxID=3234853 RepID=UPI0037D0C213
MKGSMSRRRNRLVPGWFDRLTIFPKMMVVVCMMIVSMLGIWGAGFYYLSTSTASMGVMYNRDLMPILEIGKVRTNLRTIESLFYQLTLEEDSSRYNGMIEQILLLVDENNKLLASYEQTLVDPDEQNSLEAMKQKMKEYQKKRSETIDLVLHQQSQEALEQYKLLAPLLTQINDGFQELMDYRENHALTSYQNNMQNAGTANGIMVGILLLASLLSLLSSIAIARSIANSVKGVTDWVTFFAEKTASGVSDLSQRIQVKANGEIAVLIGSFNLFIEKVQEIVHATKASVAELSASAQGMLESAGQSSDSARQVQDAIGQVTELSQTQLGNMEELAAVMEEVASGMQNIADRTAGIAEASTTMAEQTQQGNGMLQELMVQINVMNEMAGHATDEIASLGRRSEEIVEVLTMISAISRQTNLLALNAAIEASRAGEHGKGFAVVADEVRKLAQESQDATNRIEALIREIQEDSGRAAFAMDSVSKEVQTGLATAVQTGQAFEKIGVIIGDVTESLQDISANSTQVSAGAQQTSASVQELTSMAQTVSSHSNRVAGHTENQLASAVAIREMAGQLARTAESLRSMVTGYTT